jgi:ABC-2 type transport system permease protein
MVAAAVIVGYFLLTGALSAVIVVIFSSHAVRGLGLMVSPFGLVQGLKVWLFNVRGFGGGSFDVATYGPWYAVVTVLFILVGTSLIVLRYRKVDG